MKAGKVKGLDPGAPLRANAGPILSTRIEELVALAETAADPAASNSQHDMRIAAKRLRYVLEIVGGCFGDEAREARKAAKELQSVLGEIHDCDAMLPRVREQLERLGADDVRAVLARVDDGSDPDPALIKVAPNRTAYRGLELMTVHLRARRAILHQRFLELWRAQEAAGTWTALESLL